MSICALVRHLKSPIYVYIGSDIQARDYGRRMTPREWALFTGRYETADLMLRLISKPCAEQFCDTFPLEWPLLEVNASQLI